MEKRPSTVSKSVARCGFAAFVAGFVLCGCSNDDASQGNSIGADASADGKGGGKDSGVAPETGTDTSIVEDASTETVADTNTPDIQKEAEPDPPVVPYGKICPTEVGSLPSQGEVLIVRGWKNYVYFSDPVVGLRIADTTDPANPQEMTGPNIDNEIQGIQFQGEYGYLASAGLRILSVEKPDSPELIGYAKTIISNDVAISGDFAYLSAGANGMEIINIANKKAPANVSAIDTSSTAEGVAAKGDYAYLLDTGVRQVRVISVSDPAKPTDVAQAALQGAPREVRVREGIAYVASGVSGTGGFDGIEIVDVSDPKKPARVGGLAAKDKVRGMDLSQNLAFLAANDLGVWIVDITDPTSPVEVGYYDTPGSARGVSVVDYKLYVADYSGGLRIFSLECK